MKEVKITKDNFEKEVLNSKKTVLVDFYADWCGPCKMQSPILDEIAEENDNIKVCKINVDVEGELAEKYNVMSIPTMIIFKNGKSSKEFVGLTPKEKIIDEIKA